ncbi:MAG TPA: hypothetical protein VHS97_06065, partial [Isosphaeraceae bacterium]|nr:hypothetical protein [Isosphaeraceae bacterium]
ALLDHPVGRLPLLSHCVHYDYTKLRQRKSAALMTQADGPSLHLSHWYFDGHIDVAHRRRISPNRKLARMVGCI